MNDPHFVYPLRRRPGRPVVHGIRWQPAGEVPGGVLPAEVEKRLHEKLDDIDRCQRRAWVKARSYVIY